LRHLCYYKCNDKQIVNNCKIGDKGRRFYVILRGSVALMVSRHADDQLSKLQIAKLHSSKKIEDNIQAKYPDVK